MIQTFTFASESSRSIYATRLDTAANVATCNCPGWTKFARRSCWHTDHVTGVKPNPARAARAEAAAGAVNPIVVAAPAVAAARAAGIKDPAAVVAAFAPFVPTTPAPAPKPAADALVIAAWSRPRAGANGVGLKRDLPPHLLAALARMPRGDDAPEVGNGFVEPMLAAAMAEGVTVADFENLRYVMEPKFDGHRVIVAVGDSTFDCELIVPGGKSSDVVRLENRGKLVLVVFDVLTLLGVDLTGLTYAARREYLTEIFSRVTFGSAVVLAEQMPVSGAEIKRRMARGEEGVIIKALTSTYRPGYRSQEWLKVKGLEHRVVTLIGYEAGKMGPYSKVQFRDAFGIESTVKTLNAAMFALFKADAAKQVGRKFVIEFQEVQASGKYRHARFDHWGDK